MNRVSGVGWNSFTECSMLVMSWLLSESCCYTTRMLLLLIVDDAGGYRGMERNGASLVLVLWEIICQISLSLCYDVLCPLFLSCSNGGEICEGFCLC